MIGALDQKDATALIARSLEAGVNFIDTADVYSLGESEKMTGQALKDIGVKRSDVVIATKCYGRMGPGPNDIGASRGHIMDSVSRSLERLQTDHIDLYQIHAVRHRHAGRGDDARAGRSHAPGHGALCRRAPTGRRGRS